MALMALFALSDNFRRLPPIWQTLMVIVVAGLFIWGNFYFASVLQESKDKDSVDDRDDEKEQR